MFKLLQKPIGNEQNIKHNYFQNPKLVSQYHFGNDRMNYSIWIISPLLSPQCNGLGNHPMRYVLIAETEHWNQMASIKFQGLNDPNRRNKTSYHPLHLWWGFDTTTWRTVDTVKNTWFLTSNAFWANKVLNVHACIMRQAYLRVWWVGCPVCVKSWPRNNT